MIKVKLKPTSNEKSITIKKVDEHFTIVETPKEDKKVEKQSPYQGKRVVYTSKKGQRAIFDSLGLCASMLNTSPNRVKYRIEHPILKNKSNRKSDDWLKGGKIEYYNN